MSITNIVNSFNLGRDYKGMLPSAGSYEPASFYANRAFGGSSGLSGPSGSFLQKTAFYVGMYSHPTAVVEQVGGYINNLKRSFYDWINRLFTFN